MFCLRGLRAGGGGPGVLARRLGAPRDDRRVVAARAGRGWSGATGAATAATWCTPGSRSCSWAWPASSAFLEQRDVRLSPGRHASRSTATRSPTAQATAQLGGDGAGTGAPISLGAVLDVRKGDERFTLRPSRNYYSSADPSLGRDQALLRGRGHQRGRRALGPAQGLLARRAARPGLARAAASARRPPVRRLATGDVQALVIAALAERYRHDPPPAAFRAIVSPLVAWIWIGGAIAVLGALVAALALARGAPAPGAQPVRGPPGPRALARVGGARWSTPRPARARGARRARRSPPRCGGRGRAGRTDEEPASRSSRRPRRPSTARSATPSWTTAWASSRRRTGAAVDRELRAEAIEILRRARPAGGPAARATLARPRAATLPRPWKRFSAAFR